MGKKYILGNYELSLYDIVELKELIESRIDELKDYQECCKNIKLIQIYDVKLEGLYLMLAQLKRYGD